MDSHFAAEVPDDFLTSVELDSKLGVWESVCHFPIYFDGIRLWQIVKYYESKCLHLADTGLRSIFLKEDRCAAARSREAQIKL